MSVRISNATGNLTAAGTWGLVDATSYLNSEVANTALTTSAVASSTFVPAAVAIDAVALKLAVRAASPSGTITVELFNSTGTAVARTVTVNVADLPLAAVADLQGGWIVFKFGSSVTPNGTDNYSVRAFTSVASQINLFSSATTNWSRALRTTTTGSPAAGDDMIVAGELTGAGTGNSFTVTMDQTVATDYGSNSTSAATPALSICQRSSLVWGVAASTNYLLQLSGHAIVYGGGTYTQGAIGSEAPRTSTQTLQFDCAADGDFGLIVRNESVLNIVGLSRSSGKDFSWTFLSADAAVNATSLTVADDTGWLDNDVVVVASTIRPGANQNEAGALNGNAGASSITVDGFAGVAGGIAFAHLGGSTTNSSQNVTLPDGTVKTCKMQAEIINLTRNVVVRAVTSGLTSFVAATNTAQVFLRWAEFTRLGTNVTGKRGVDCNVNTSGSLDVRFCSFHDSDFGGLWLADTTTAFYGAQIRDNVFYKTSTSSSAVGIRMNTVISGGGGAFVINRNVIIDMGAGYGISLADLTGTCTNNSVVGAQTQRAFFLSQGGIVPAGKLDANVIHSSAANGLDYLIFISGQWGDVTLKDWAIWRNSMTQGAIGTTVNPTRIALEGCLMWAQGSSVSTGPITQGAMYRITMKNCVMASDTTQGSGIGVGLWMDGGLNVVEMENCVSSPPTAGGFLAPMSSDINCGVGGSGTPIEVRLIGRAVVLGGTLPVNTANSTLSNYSYISIERLNNTAGNHKTWVQNGTIATDAVIFRTASPSARLTPTSASVKCVSAPVLRGFKIPVLNGVARTTSIYVRKSVIGDGAAYNGSQPRWIVRANPAIGLAVDTVLATAAGAAGSFEQLSGALPAPTDDGAFEVYVDCDGTAGWVNVDDLAAS